MTSRPGLAGAIVLFGLLLPFGAPVKAKTTWQGVLPNTMPSQSNAIFKIAAVDGEHAWTVGKRNTGGNDEIVGLRTTNGTSWQPMSLPQGTSFFPVIPTALIFADANQGYLGATELEGISEVNKIFVTSNGGTSWTEQARVDAAPLAFQRLPSGEIFGVGGGYVVRTLDGQTWTSHAVDGPSADVVPAGISMLNATCGFLVGGWGADSDHTNSSDGAVWYTGDGGETWALRAQDLPFFLGAASFVASDLGWAVGQQDGGTGVLAQTTDGGHTFSLVTVPDHPAVPDACVMSQCLTDPSPVTDMIGVRFWDAARGIAQGLACTGGCGAGEEPTYLTVFLRTYDGGSSWEYDADYEPVMPDISMTMLTLPGEMTGMLDGAFPDPNHIFLAGQYEMILRYEADWIEDPAQSPPSCTATVADGGVGPQPDGGVDPRPDGGDDHFASLSGCGCQGAAAPGAWLAWPLGLLLLGLRLGRRRGRRP